MSDTPDGLSMADLQGAFSDSGPPQTSFGAAPAGADPTPSWGGGELEASDAALFGDKSFAELMEEMAVRSEQQGGPSIDVQAILDGQGPEMAPGFREVPTAAPATPAQQAPGQPAQAPAAAPSGLPPGVTADQYADSLIALRKAGLADADLQALPMADRVQLGLRFHANQAAAAQAAQPPAQGEAPSAAPAGNQPTDLELPSEDDLAEALGQEGAAAMRPILEAFQARDRASRSAVDALEGRLQRIDDLLLAKGAFDARAQVAREPGYQGITQDGIWQQIQPVFDKLVKSGAYGHGNLVEAVRAASATVIGQSLVTATHQRRQATRAAQSNGAMTPTGDPRPAPPNRAQQGDPFQAVQGLYAQLRAGQIDRNTAAQQVQQLLS